MNIWDRVVEKFTSVRFWITIMMVSTGCYIEISSGREMSKGFASLLGVVIYAYFNRVRNTNAPAGGDNKTPEWESKR